MIRTVPLIQLHLAELLAVTKLLRPQAPVAAVTSVGPSVFISFGLANCAMAWIH